MLVLNSQVTACVKGKLYPTPSASFWLRRETAKALQLNQPCNITSFSHLTTWPLLRHCWAPSKLSACPGRHHFSGLHKAEPNSVNICSAPCLQTPLFCLSLNARGQISHPYKTMGKIIVLTKYCT